MTIPRCPLSRVDQDWSVEGRADMGRAVIDLAPDVNAGWPCAVIWYGWKLGHGEDHENRHWLKQLLDRMANVGILVKIGGLYQCGECPRMHQAPCEYQLAMGRHEAQERWCEVVQGHRWWYRTGIAP